MKHNFVVNFGLALLLSTTLGLFSIKAQVPPIPPPDQEMLAELVQATPPTGIERFLALSHLAKAAFDAAELNKAEDYARELLSAAHEHPKWNRGNAIFYGNMVIGRVALRRDRNVALANSSLLASAQTPGSPTLNTFGPNMSLARDLLTVGERDTVLEFFTLCRSFWKMDFGKLDDWTAIVKDGGIPDFGGNLVFY